MINPLEDLEVWFLFIYCYCYYYYKRFSKNYEAFTFFE